MKRLFIIYDADCALCRRICVWLGNQPVYVPLSFVPLKSMEAQCRFPEVHDLRPAEQLVVISDLGEVWRGESAWITILRALPEYREWSLPPAGGEVLRGCRRESAHASGWAKSATHNDLHVRLTCQPIPMSCATQGISILAEP